MRVQYQRLHNLFRPEWLFQLSHLLNHRVMKALTVIDVVVGHNFDKFSVVKRDFGIASTYINQLDSEHFISFLVRVDTWQDFDLDFSDELARQKLNLTFSIDVVDTVSRVQLLFLI